jgi:hypothetical protein
MACTPQRHKLLSCNRRISLELGPHAPQRNELLHPPLLYVPGSGRLLHLPKNGTKLTTHVYIHLFIYLFIHLFIYIFNLFLLWLKRPQPCHKSTKICDTLGKQTTECTSAFMCEGGKGQPFICDSKNHHVFHIFLIIT